MSVIATSFLKFHKHSTKVLLRCVVYQAPLSVKESHRMSDADWKKATTIYDFTVKNAKGEDVPLSKYKGQVCLIVNVASKCGFTNSNYTQLEELYKKYKDQGLRILGFPCNQFGNQEPGSETEIVEFCSRTYNVSFDIFKKVDVNGDNASPLWNFLKNKQHGFLIDAIKWNFTKFLIDKNGIPVKRYAPNQEPKTIEKDIAKYLEQPAANL